MTEVQIRDLLYKKAVRHSLNPKLVTAIAVTESSLNPWAARYEPEFKYILTAEKFAKLNGITAATETQFQKTSIGLMQVMGAVFRELGYTEALPMAFIPDISVEYGCLKLVRIMRTYSSLSDVIASYNAGSPRMDSSGALKNQHYVDTVFKNMGAT